MAQQRWQIWLDRGGTFTDCVGLAPDGSVGIVKVLSCDDAPLQAIRQLLGLGPDAPIPACDVRFGTTLATNALLERTGRATALVITRGFADLQRIGNQTRPDLFALDIRRPEPLPSEVIEVDARNDSEGRVLTRPDAEQLEQALRAASRRGITSLAVVVLHSPKNPELELEIERVARRVGFEHIALSHRVSPETGLLSRADTTVLDAYLSPLLIEHVKKLETALPSSTLLAMQSSGGLVAAQKLSGPTAIVSGPAGGVVAVQRIADALGLGPAIGFDMGGTSTDVSRSAGEPSYLYETEVSGVRVRTPMLEIHTVAAGGGSICRLDGQRPVVGPESAGARPGPLAFGHPDARELTLTDVNLLLGRLPVDHFRFPLDLSRARRHLVKQAAELRDRGVDLDEAALGEGYLEVASSAMAEAVRRISIARGHDVRTHTLVVFGGAGGQHACAVARRLGMKRLVVHPLAGVQSAFGIGLSDRTTHVAEEVRSRPLDDSALRALDAHFDALCRRAEHELGPLAEGRETLALHRRVDLAYDGSETRLTLPVATSALRLAQEFHRLHALRHGHSRPNHPVLVRALRVEGRASSVRPALPLPPPGRRSPEPESLRRVFFEGRWLASVPCFQRNALGVGSELAGPLLVIENTAALFLEPGFSLTVLPDGSLDVRDTTRRALRTEQRAAAPEIDPVALEIFSNLFMSIAEQMGEALRRTAFSTNIRERLDYSCAVFDSDGGLVANAPHIPVHLGAMSESVRALLAAGIELWPGDVFATNDPAAGGSHLPDITLISPIFDGAGQLTHFTANRGHHADVGGITPGSMPAFSRSLAEEGVIFHNTCVVRGGRFDRARVEAILRSGPYPARDPEANLLDLEAQIAANATGAELLRALQSTHGTAVRDYMRHVQTDARRHVESLLRQLGDGEHSFADALDDGTRIALRLRIFQGRMLVDFTGTGPESDGNLNAPRAVTLAAVLYCLRALVGRPIPLNSGCLEPIELVIPPRSLLDPAPERAVSGGNVETSQRIVDVLLGALGKVAASQGTMNNLTFGGSGFSYYETIAGGAGAGPGFPGASAVHTHMTNTRITDAEVLETRFPVRLERFAIRRGSGGAGAFRGGDGVIRELTFLAPAEVSIVSERRSRAPFGQAGGSPGAMGRNSLDGREVGGRASFHVEPGARLCIETPGGGGFGEP